MSPARLAAAQVLVMLERGRTTIADLTEKHRAGIQTARDRALFLEIVAGSVRWLAELDACLAAKSSRPLTKLTPEVRAVLRSAAYQLLHLDRVPSHAVVSEAVEVIRGLRQPRAAGFVNAVLRNLLRGDPRRALPKRPTNDVGEEAAVSYLSVSLSHPEWLVRRWLKREGFEVTEKWCQFNNLSPSVAIRPTGSASLSEVAEGLAAAGTEALPSRFFPGSFVLGPGALGQLPPEVRDRIRIQDEGSQLVAMTAGVRPGDRVLDVCAAPGGKTMILAELAGMEGEVIASDFRRSRVILLRTLLQRAGFHLPVLALDATQPLPFKGVFDCVLLDAPCSGLGTLRRDPDLKWSRRESDLTRFATGQAAMIRHAAEAVRSGGSLVYATCSSEPEENEAIVDGFLSDTPAFRVEPIAGVDERLLTPRGFLLTSPARDALDVFFAARLVRLPAA